jgi:hypothetical protein
MKTFNILLLSVMLSVNSSATDILIEAESFADRGGWVVDNQSMRQMGSPYLMAHGLGTPVADAVTDFLVPKSGDYRVWVRTRDWIKTWGREGSPGRFIVAFNSMALDSIFGTERAEWHWQDGGTVALKKGRNRITLHDLTGFNGRCDAVYLTADLKKQPGEDSVLGGCPVRAPEAPPAEAGEYDLVVAGGGMAGCCAAIAAARLGCKVALIQNRPVLGGNNSSEVRVGLSGRIMQEPYPNLGNLLDEFGTVGYHNNVEAKENPETERSRQIAGILEQSPEKHIHNAGPATNYEDEKKEQLVRNEKNITLFLNMQVIEAEKRDDAISAVTGQDIMTGRRYRFRGALFADCTGDGTLGALAGADCRMGRESKAETGEPRAPLEADSLVMGTSVQWYATESTSASAFPDCPWALAFSDSTCSYSLRGDWDWETGMNSNQIEDIEYIRDYGLRAVFGNWSFLKNHSSRKAEYAEKQLSWVAYIGGKRESRRLLGDIILQEQDVLQGVRYEDASFTTTWSVDLHYPKPVEGMEEEPFLSYASHEHIKPYAVPYRCLYSRNVSNLFMAGRNISVTHVALGTVRVMRTGAMMGEVVGMAASICRNHKAKPRQVYQSFLPELQELMKKGIGTPGFGKLNVPKKTD